MTTDAREQSPYPTDREWAFLLHLDTLTTAIEDALKELKTPGDLIRDCHIQAILETAHDAVWKRDTGGES